MVTASDSLIDSRRLLVAVCPDAAHVPQVLRHDTLGTPAITGFECVQKGQMLLRRPS